MSQLRVNAISDAAGANGNAITLATDGTCTAKITNNLSNRNLIINGSMICAQRSSSSTSNGYKTVDRFSHFSGGGTATWSVGTETSGTVWEKGLRKYLRCTNTANATAAGNYREITYKIENQDLMGSGWNPASASSKLTLSFWVRASVAQTYYGRIRWMGDSADKNFVFSTGSLSANTWTKVTVSIPGLAGKTLNDGGSSADNSSIFQLNWSPFQGTDGTASGTALNTWNAYAGSSKYPDYTTTWGSTDGATFDITGVQLEVGDTATDFEHRSYGDELARCKRYYHHWVDSWTAEKTLGIIWASYDSTGAHGTLKIDPQMRDIPTLKVANATNAWQYIDGNSDDFDTIAANSTGRWTNQTVELYASGNLSTTTGRAAFVRCKASPDTTYIAFDAEL